MKSARNRVSMTCGNYEWFRGNKNSVAQLALVDQSSTADEREEKFAKMQKEMNCMCGHMEYREICIDQRKQPLKR